MPDTSSSFERIHENEGRLLFLPSAEDRIAKAPEAVSIQPLCSGAFQNKGIRHIKETTVLLLGTLAEPPKALMAR